MSRSVHPFRDWLNAKEDEHREFKEAKNNFHFEKLVKYCAALANESGGSIVLGVTDKPPRKIVGSRALGQSPPDRHKAERAVVPRIGTRVWLRESCERPRMSQIFIGAIGGRLDNTMGCVTVVWLGKFIHQSDQERNQNANDATGCRANGVAW